MSLSNTTTQISKAVADTLVRRDVVDAAAHRYRPAIQRQTLTGTPAAWVVPGPIQWERIGRAVQQLSASVDIVIRAACDTGNGVDESVCDLVIDKAEEVADTMYAIAPALDGDPDPVTLNVSLMTVEILETLIGEEFEDHKVAASVVRVTYRVHR